jgi:lipopolysaccharide biosynthesis regulator YciM
VGAALVLLLVGMGALAAGVLIGRYYVPDDRLLRRTARHARAYMRALSYHIARDHETVVKELRGVVEENIEDVEPYFALGALFRSRGEHERAIRVHQALAIREHEKRKQRLRAMYELGLDFRAAGMPRRATRALENVLLEDPSHIGALRVLAALYEEQARFNEAAGLWQRLGRRRNESSSHREHHLLVAAAQAALARDDLDSAKNLLKAAHRHEETAHFFAAAAELAAARGNHRGAKERLKQALVAEPGLITHLLPGLIAAEQGIMTAERTGKQGGVDEDELAEPSGEEPPKQLEGAQDQPALPEATSAEASGALAVTTSGTLTTTSSGAFPVTAIAPMLSGPAAASRPVAAGVEGISLAPSKKPPATVTKRVLATLADIEAQTGPRLEIALVRAQLAEPSAHDEIARDLAVRFPDALAARVASARLALGNGSGNGPDALRSSLEALVSDQGALAWALRGRWQCANCGHRPGPFSWRCGSCRRWNTLRIETGVEPPPITPRDRRSESRITVEGLLGSRPDESLPSATLDPGLSTDELAVAGTRRSLLGRMGGWFGNVWRRERR